MRLLDKVAVVTGGGSGIGRGICAAFAAEGAAVVVVDMAKDKAQAAAEEIAANGGAALALAVDITKAAEVSGMTNRVIDRFGKIDILVNNAGRRHIRPFLEHSEAEWREMLDVNLTGHFLCCKAVVPLMIAAGRGRIVNVVSVAAIQGRPNRVGYCASKGGCLAFTRALAADLAGTGITVNALNPGLIATPFNAQFTEDDAVGPQWAHENLAGLWGTPEDIAEAALYLASDGAGYITGESINLDGGSAAAMIRSGEVG